MGVAELETMCFHANKNLYTKQQIVNYFASLNTELGSPSWNGECSFRCLIHNDQNPSASVNIETGLWNCLACHRGGTLFTLENLLADDDYMDWHTIRHQVLDACEHGLRSDLPHKAPTEKKPFEYVSLKTEHLK